MKIIPNFWSVIWTPKRGSVALQADMPKSLYATAAEARAAFKARFPNDVVLGVKDSKGRFA